MSYRWKPNKAQKQAYIEKMNEKNSLPIIVASGAIRVGCYVRYYSIASGCEISGLVIKSSYGKLTNQHTFTINNNGMKVNVKGRNLYPNLLEHIQGEQSKIETIY